MVSYKRITYIAEMLECKRETLSRTMKVLQEENLVNIEVSDEIDLNFIVENSIEMSTMHVHNIYHSQIVYKR